MHYKCQEYSVPLKMLEHMQQKANFRIISVRSDVIYSAYTHEQQSIRQIIETAYFKYIYDLTNYKSTENKSKIYTLIYSLHFWLSGFKNLICCLVALHTSSTDQTLLHVASTKHLQHLNNLKKKVL